MIHLKSFNESSSNEFSYNNYIQTFKRLFKIDKNRDESICFDLASLEKDDSDSILWIDIFPDTKRTKERFELNSNNFCFDEWEEILSKYSNFQLNEPYSINKENYEKLVILFNHLRSDKKIHYLSKYTHN